MAKQKKMLAIKGGKPLRRKPFPEWPQFGREERSALLDAFDKGEWWYGKRVARFEKAFASFQGAKYAVSCTSGTVALELALKASGVGKGDEVILPAYTFIATATAVLAVGAKPVFVDVSPLDWNIDPKCVEAAVSSRTRALLPVHFAGIPADMSALMRIARRHKLVVIEDAAQAWGARRKGKGTGSWGAMGAFSFQRSKNITAGEGGILVMQKEADAEVARSLTNSGRLPGGKWYEHHLPGGNYRLTEFQAAILLAQLKRFRSLEAKRKANASYLDRHLAEIEGLYPLRLDKEVTRRAYHLYNFRYEAQRFAGPGKAEFVAALRAEGIPLYEGYILPLYKQPLFLNRRNSRHLSCPVTEKLCGDQGVWLHHSLLLGTRKDMDDVVKAIRKVQENY
jgi:dTDP-4-amino-4,6-dideoxygalactose transaminase